MRIGITCYPTYGGSGALATELGLELARRGHEVHFITYASPFRLPRRVRGASVLPRSRDPDGALPAVRALPVLARPGVEAARGGPVGERSTSCTSTTPFPTPRPPTSRGKCCGPSAHCAIITTLHGTDITLVGQESSFYSITKFSIEQSDEVTAVSQFLRDETYRAFGCVSCDLKVIPNFVNLAEYHPVAKRRDGTRPRRRGTR